MLYFLFSLFFIGFDRIQKEVTEIRNAAQHEMILNETSEREEVIEYLLDLKQRIGKQQDEAKRINDFQKIFSVAESGSEELNETSEEVQLKLNLWIGGHDFEEITRGWREEHFGSLDIGKLEETINAYNKMVFRMERGLPPNKVSGKVKFCAQVFEIGAHDRCTTILFVCFALMHRFTTNYLRIHESSVTYKKSAHL